MPLVCRVALRLTRPTTPLPGSGVTQHPGAGGLKIAETFPAGQEPHGAGDKSKVPGGASHYPAYNARGGLSEGYSTPQARQAPPGRTAGRGAAYYCRWRLRRVPANILPTQFTYLRLLNTPDPASAAPPGKDNQARCRLCAGWRFAYPAYGSFTYQKATQHRRPGKRARRRAGQRAGAEPLVCQVALRLPGRSSCDLSLIYSPALLKLPVLTASKSLRRSRKAGAARMDAG